jgi:hypothetical protein
MVDQSELHNRLAGPIVASIVRPVIEAGGNGVDILVLTESVVTGVFLAVVKLGGDEPVAETLLAGVKKRLTELRLCKTEPKGDA